MIHDNVIYKLLIETLDENEGKKLVSLWPDQIQEPARQWVLPLIFSDGTKVTKETGLDNKEFIKEWREFKHWYRRIGHVVLKDDV